jgi:CRP-like cAMP-binding protein
MDLVSLLKSVAVFEGLSDAELERVARLCREARYLKGDVITTQGQPGYEMFIVHEGMVEVHIGAGGAARSVVNLGTGQVVGEMALVDGGPRSATVRCVADTLVYVIERDAFERLCDAHHHIGLVVYRNLAADLSFKLRHEHLTRR